MPRAIGRFAADGEIILTMDGPERKWGLIICITTIAATRKIYRELLIKNSLR
jgi:hypothetical protein